MYPWMNCTVCNHEMFPTNSAVHSINTRNTILTGQLPTFHVFSCAAIILYFYDLFHTIQSLWHKVLNPWNVYCISVCARAHACTVEDHKYRNTATVCHLDTHHHSTGIRNQLISEKCVCGALDWGFGKKVILSLYTLQRYIREVEVLLHSFLTSNRWRWVVILMPLSLCCLEKEAPVVTWALELAWTFWREEKKFYVLGFKSQTIQPRT